MGFEIFSHPLDDDSARIWQHPELELDRDLAVIHLRRRNVRRAVVSRAIAEQRNVWLDLADEPRVGRGSKPVAISRAELEAAFRQTHAWEAAGDLRFANHRVLTLFYEELVADTDAAFSTVTDFLGVRFARPSAGCSARTRSRCASCCSATTISGPSSGAPSGRSTSTSDPRPTS